MTYAYTAREVCDLLGAEPVLGNIPEDSLETIGIDSFHRSAGTLRNKMNRNSCFVAMTYESWLRGSANVGHYASRSLFDDSHPVVLRMYQKSAWVREQLKCLVCERVIPELVGIVPQLLVSDAYPVLQAIAVASRKKMDGNAEIIAVTGSSGKSTTVAMLNLLSQDERNVICNAFGNNSRIVCAEYTANFGRFQPGLMDANKKKNLGILEVAIAALWCAGGGVCNQFVHPTITVITRIALTQYQKGSRNIDDVVRIKSKVCNGIVPGGKAVLYRDMDKFEDVRSAVVGYGATPVTYGFTPDCDTVCSSYQLDISEKNGEIVAKNLVKATILGEYLEYEIGCAGRPVVMNSLAALTAAKLAGLDIQRLVHRLAEFHGKDNCLKISKIGGVTLIDDTHNSGVEAYVEACDLMRQIPRGTGGRYLNLLSRKVNFGGSDDSPKLHLELLQPIRNSGAEKVFLHDPMGYEFSLVNERLEKRLNGGVYRTAKQVVLATIEELRQGDVVLLKGCPRGCDFGEVLPLFLKGLRAKFEENRWEVFKNSELAEENTAVAPVEVVIPPQSAKIPLSAAAFSCERNQVVASIGDTEATYEGGLGLALVTYYLLRCVHNPKSDVQFTDAVTIDSVAAKLGTHPSSLGLHEGDSWILLNLFRAMLLTEAADATMAVARHLQKTALQNKTGILGRIKRIGKEWGLSEKSIGNITGKLFTNVSQGLSVGDLLICARELLSFDMRGDLAQHMDIIQGKGLVTRDGILHKRCEVTRLFTFSSDHEQNHALVLSEINGETVFIAVAGAASPQERDAAVMRLIDKANPTPKPVQDHWIEVADETLAIAGDTYCGERYTKWRKRRGIDDPIQKYGDDGYEYSFESVVPLLKDSYTIVNSECVVNDEWDRQQQTGYYFPHVLGARPGITEATYHTVGINAVMCANNHIMDFGSHGLRQNRRHFERNDIPVIGAGSNVEEATRPLLLRISGRRVIVFNAYCFAENHLRHQLYQICSLGSNTGCSDGTIGVFGEGAVYARIREYREKYPDAYIVFSPHWSDNFVVTHKRLVKYAEKAIDRGADLVVGHGPHIALGTTEIKGKPVLYSLGHLVFNTTGLESDKCGEKAYGMLCKLRFDGEKPAAFIYPLYCHQINTFFQPHLITDKEMLDDFYNYVWKRNIRPSQDPVYLEKEKCYRWFH